MLRCVQAIPEGDWFCDPCALGLAPREMTCGLCLTPGGALLPVADHLKREVAHRGGNFQTNKQINTMRAVALRVHVPRCSVL